MCGIAGVVRRGRIVPDDRSLLSRLCDAMCHRGPDGEGHFVNDHVAFGMRRLAIIDLNGGWQPLYNEDKSVALVANGEVYNYVELGAELRARGHQFRTGSDCEMIAHAYEEWGDDFVHRLRGMYAFALWDDRRQRLLIGRDRLGEKPLYVVRTDDRIVFASELKTILQAGIVPFELDPDGVNLFLHYDFIPEPRTAVRGVTKLPAGHLMIVEPATWDVRVERYWSFDDIPPLAGDPVTLVRDQLEELSGIITRSDVPVGVALSGGFDSSSIAALAARHTPAGLTAVTVGYRGNVYQDESGQARELADHLKLPITRIELDTDEVMRDLPRVMYDRDDPIGDASGPSYAAIMRHASAAGLKVMLLGQGGDELFWGYGPVRDALAGNVRRLAAAAGQSGLGDYLRVRKPPRSYTGLRSWARDFAGIRDGWNARREDLAARPGQLVFYETAAWFRDRLARGISSILTPEFAATIHARDPRQLAHLGSRPENLRVEMIRLISETYLRENGMTQGDRLGMAHSVEVRLPLCDYRLFETVVGLEKASVDRAVEPKKWLREAMRPFLPEFVYTRPKRGFTPPWRPWQNARMAMYGDRLRDGELVRRGIVTRATAERLLKPIGRFGVATPFAESVLTLELWVGEMRAGIERAALSPTGRTSD